MRLEFAAIVFLATFSVPSERIQRTHLHYRTSGRYRPGAEPGNRDRT